MNKQELKEKIIKIINNNYYQDYYYNYLDIDAIEKEIEKLFNEVE